MIEDTPHGLVGVRSFGLRHGRRVIRVYGLMYVPANGANKINPCVTFQRKRCLEITKPFIGVLGEVKYLATKSAIQLHVQQ